MSRAAVLAGLVLLGSTPAFAQEDPLTRLPVRVRSPEDFPLGLPAVEEPVIALDYLRLAASKPPEPNINGRFNQPGPQNVYRWVWLRAKRRNLDHYDGLARKAAGLEKEFWKEHAAAVHPQKDAYERYGHEFEEFLNRRLILREEWYYTAGWHRFRWEQDRPGGPKPWIARVEQGLCKALGCTTLRFEWFLARVDLLATEVFPGHMSLWLTTPLSLLS